MHRTSNFYYVEINFLSGDLENYNLLQYEIYSYLSLTPIKIKIFYDFFKVISIHNITLEKFYHRLEESSENAKNIKIQIIIENPIK